MRAYDPLVAKKDPDWKRYEKQILRHIRAKAGSGANIQYDQKIEGKLSLQKRQVDIWVTEINIGFIEDGTAMIDCKHVKSNPDPTRKIDIKDVEQFIGMVDDVDADFGILISNAEFTPAALRRVRRGIRLRSVRPAELDFLDEEGRLIEAMVPIRPGGSYSGTFVEVGYVEAETIARVDYEDPEENWRPVFVGPADTGWGTPEGNRSVVRAILRDYTTDEPEDSTVDLVAEEFEERLEDGQEWTISIGELEHLIGRHRWPTEPPPKAALYEWDEDEIDGDPEDES